MDFDLLPQADVDALHWLVKQVAHENMIIAEVGCWKGHSTSILAKECLPYHGKVYAVDHWVGTQGEICIDEAKTKDIYSIFKQNMIETGVWQIIHPMVMDSETAAMIFKDNILDLVFIDADHRYGCVKGDILNWLPKLQLDGIISGHDCDGYYTQYPEDKKVFIDNSAESNYMVLPTGGGLHPGVIKALYDCFDDRYSKAGFSVWHIEKRIALCGRKTKLADKPIYLCPLSDRADCCVFEECPLFKKCFPKGIGKGVENEPER